MTALSRALAGVALFILSIGSASGAALDFNVLFDADNDATTGCTVSGFSGVEHVLLTRVETTTPSRVTSVATQTCTFGFLSAPSTIDATGWPAAFDATSGELVVESRIARSFFGPGPRFGFRVGFFAQAGALTNSLFQDAAGNSLRFPVAKSRRRLASIVPNRVITLDGLTADWVGISPLGSGNGLPSLRFTEVFGYFDEDALYFRFEAQTNPNAPTAVDDSYSVDPGATLNVTAPGVLANDSDPLGRPLTASIESTTTHGAVVLNADGSFTYVNDGTGTRDEFSYTATNGDQSSNIARASISIGELVNRAPVGVSDTYGVGQGGTLTVPAPGVLGNDTDADGDALTARLGTGTTRGSLTLNGDGSFTYVNAGLAGPDAFTYFANDGFADSAEITVTINVAPNLPPTAFNDSYTVAEGGTLNVPSPGVLVNDSDPDTPISELSITAASLPANGTLTIGANGAFTYVHNGSETTSDSFTYFALDGFGISNAATVTITITPVNDAPSFTKGPDVVVTDTAGPQTVVGWAQNVSPGPGNESTQVVDFIVSNNNNAIFAAQPFIAANGTLTFTPLLGAFGVATVTVQIHDNGGTANGGVDTSAAQTFTITIQRLPAFTSGNAVTFTIGIPNSFAVTTTGFPVAALSVTGALPAGVTFVDNNDGTATLSGTAAGGTSGSYPLTINATNSVGTTPQSFGLTVVCPTITVSSPANAAGVAGAAFSETFTQTGAVGTATFTIATGTLPAGLTLATNGVLSGTPTQTGSFPITVTATDSNGCTGTSATYTLSIACPTITIANPANTNGTVTSPFSETFSQSGAVGTATFTTASALPTGLTLGTDGVLSGTPTQSGTFDIVVTVTDSNGCTGTSAAYTLVVACQTISITNPANATGPAGSPFSETFTQTGGVAPVSFATASTLPTGLTLATNGVLSGTPTQGGTFPIVVTVTDANGCTGTSATYNLVITCPAIAVTNPANANGTANSAFSETFTQTGAIGTATFTLASGTLPAGLTLEGNGLLSGTPTQTGSFPITVTVTDANGCTGTSATYTIVIGCQTITVTNPANANGTAGSAFSETFTQTDAIGTATFTLASGTLPAGLTLASNGVVSGTPTQTGSFPITVTVTDANGCTGTSATYTIVIGCQVITVTNPANANGTIGASFSETFTQTGAIGSATFSTSSTLPAGLTFAANGVLSGTPTEQGTFPIVVTVTDANGCTGTSATYNLVIGCQTITVTNPANASGTVATPFGELFTQTGAIGTATFTTASTLPSGLTLATDGTLSGTPTQSGTFPIVVTVTDSNGCTGTSATYDLVIACNVITVTNPTNESGTVGVTFSETFTQTGGNGTVTFTTSSTLPNGLSLSATGVLSGIPTQTGTFPIVVVATDSNGCTGTSATYTLVIACQTITVTNPGVTTGTRGTSFSQTFTQTDAIGTATFTTSSTLPAGLTLGTDGVLSGTPTEPGTFPIVVTVTDSNGCTGTSATYNLVIACNVITVTNPGVTAGIYNSAFSVTFTQTGAIGTTTFTLASGTLPAGLTLAANGVLSGTPTQTGTFPITVTATDDGPCSGTGATYTLTIAPVASNDTYSNIVGNTQAVVTGGTTVSPSTPFVEFTTTLVANDQPAGGVSAPVGTFATTAGGSVTIEADGTFIYTPSANPGAPLVTADSFTYTVVSNGVTSAPATVSLNLANRVWYVNNIGGGTNGQSQSPFTTLAAAESASTADDIIYVYTGDNTTNGQNSGFNLKNGQQLLGQGVTLVVNTHTLVVAGTHAKIGNSAGAGVTGNNVSTTQIRGLSISAGSGHAISYLVNSPLTTISDNIITAATLNGINIANTAVPVQTSVTITNNQITATGVGINMTGSASTVTAFANNTITGNNGGTGVNIANATFDAVLGIGIQPVLGGVLTIGDSGNPVGGGGLSLGGTQGQLDLTNLSIYNASGSGIDLTSSGSGFTFRVNPGGAPTGIVQSTGPAVVTGAGVVLDLRLANLISTNSAATGVSLTNTLGTFSAEAGSSITNPTGTAFNISGGTANVTYAGTIFDNTGQLISISGTTAGTKTFSGAIDDLDGTGDPIGGGTANNGGGISLSSNTGATITFSGGVNLSTGATAAFSATGGGTIEVCDENPCNAAATGALVNSLTTTTGTALNVANTTISANNLEFRSISANGAASGIVLNTTGATGSLRVNGNSAAGTGGTIQATTGDAISLTSTQSPSFQFLNVTNTGGQGLNANNLTAGFTLTSCQFSQTGNGDNEHAIRMLDISGTVSIQGTSFNNTAEDFLNIDSNTNLSQMNLNVGTVTACTFTQPNTIAAIRASGAFAGNGILLQHRGSKNYTINLSNSTFTDIKLAGIQVGSSGSTSTASNVNVNINNNDFLVTITNTSGNPNNRANLINVQALNTLDIDASITNNVLDGGGGGGIQLGADNSANLNANITGNTVSDQFADGILMATDENASLTVLIDNNQISNTSSDGIEISNAISPGGTSVLNATITNNLVNGHNNNAGANAFVAGIAIFGGVEAADQTNIDIRNNSVSGNPNPTVYFDYYTQGFGDTIQVEGPTVAAVTEPAFLSPGVLGNQSSAAAGGKTFLADVFFNNNVPVPLPVLTP